MEKGKKDTEIGQKTIKKKKKSMTKKPEMEISQTKFHLCRIYIRKNAATV